MKARQRRQFAANSAQPKRVTVVNTTDYEIRRAREELAGWAGALDYKRPTAWTQYGYPTEVTFSQLLTAYERGGPGQGAVHRILDKCWQEPPRIKTPDSDEPSAWEKALGKLFKGVQVWKKLRDFDRRNLVGRYSALIYRVADGKELREQMGRAQKLVDIVPLYEDQIKVIAWHTDQKDAERFGTPSMYQYRMRQVRKADRQAQPDTWVDVHPSRVQILAEGSVGDMFEGQPLLQAGFNHLIDLEKVGGGSAESFLKNSARTLVVKFDANSSPQVITQNPDGSASGKTVSEVIEEKTQNLNRNIDASIVMQGGEATTLQTQQSDPTKAFDVAANLFAASVRIPFTILFGQQTGRLASNEDQQDMNARCMSRQENELTPMIEQFITRMQAAGLIAEGEFEVEWPPLDAPGAEDEADLLNKYTTAMKQAFDAGLTEPLFDANELRAVAGFEERADDGMPTEEDLARQAAAEAAAQQKPRLAA